MKSLVVSAPGCSVCVHRLYLSTYKVSVDFAIIYNYIYTQI